MRNINEYEKVYDAVPIERIQELYRKKHVIDIIKKYKHDSILEIGCGKEPLFCQFTDFETMTIVEPSKMFSDNAIKLSEGKKEIYVINDFFENCYEDLSIKEYDVIVISALLHELENPLSFLEFVIKCCGPTTIVHINVPNADSVHRILAKEMGIIRDVHQLSDTGIRLQQNSVFDIAGLSFLTTKSGFEVIEQGSFIPKFFSYHQLSMMLDNGIIDESYFDGMDKLTSLFPNNGSEIYINVKKCENI